MRPEQKGHRIQAILPDSIAEELALQPGDLVLAVNDQIIEDVFDYEYLCQDEYLELLVHRVDEEAILFEIEKEYKEDLGIVFENGLMDEYRSCRNKCVFCFVDQMPEGMRETLYFKDDDSRLSFLQGNYITLTNMSDQDIERIIRYHLEPVNISIHTMNPELRCQILQNRFAGEALQKLKRLYEAGIEMNGQIVQCQGINDGAELADSIQKLTEYLPYMKSVSVVPVGLTKYRNRLVPLEPVTKETASQTIEIVEAWQQRLYPEHGLHFIHASDEFYIMTGRPIPDAEQYDDFPQLDNGVGAVRLLLDEFAEALDAVEGDGREAEISLATGILIAPNIQDLVKDFQKKFPGMRIHVYVIRNHFFGESITVAGLITGQDLKEQLHHRPLGQRLLLSVNMLRSGERIFLDDVTVEQLEQALQVDVNIVKSSGADLLHALMGETDMDTGYRGYELKEYPSGITNGHTANNKEHPSGITNGHSANNKEHPSGITNGHSANNKET